MLYEISSLSFLMKAVQQCIDDCRTSPEKFGSMLLRLSFGILFLFVAIKKFRMGYGGFAEALMNDKQSLLANEFPIIILFIYGIILPLVEAAVGIFLLVNKYVKESYIAIGFMYLTFIFGQMYQGNTAKIGTEYFPSIIALILAMYLYDRISIIKK